MISYKLAKELKDCGFEQRKLLNESKYYFGDNNIVQVGVAKERGIDIDNDSAYIPTLSELIDACGEIRTIRKEDNKWYVCTTKDDGHGNLIDFMGDSLEEIVARLYIKLNK